MDELPEPLRKRLKNSWAETCGGCTTSGNGLAQHMQETGEHLLERAFEQVTDEQLDALALKRGQPRMDSTMPASNIRQMGRVQVLVTVLQRVHRMRSEEDRERYADLPAPSLKGHPGHDVYQLPADRLDPGLGRPRLQSHHHRGRHRPPAHPAAPAGRAPGGGRRLGPDPRAALPRRVRPLPGAGDYPPGAVRLAGGAAGGCDSHPGNDGDGVGRRGVGGREHPRRRGGPGLAAGGNERRSLRCAPRHRPAGLLRAGHRLLEQSLAANLPPALLVARVERGLWTPRPRGLAHACRVPEAKQRAEVLAGLAPRLAQRPREQLYPLWQETLHMLAARTRRDLLADLGALEPVIAALGGAEAVEETFRANPGRGRLVAVR
ncbi:MAG: hypothetical protein Q9O62_02445 [Ardenticatenia bacterium]|nr:hypothetical protein [Ardenticatenia bacterium]